MPANQLQNAQTASQHFKSVNGHLKKEFILYGEAGEEGIKLVEPEKTASIGNKVDDLASAEMATPVHLTKKVLYSKTAAGQPPNNAGLAIVNEDGVFETLVWTTTPAQVQSALRSGVFESRTIQNPLAKMIARLGEYKRTVFERSVEEGFVVKHNQEKLAIVDVTQECIAALQPLHRMINNYKGADSPPKNLQDLIAQLEEVTTKLTEIKKNNITNAFDDLSRKLHTSIDALTAKVDNYRSQLVWRLNSPVALTAADMQSLLSPFANPLSNPDLSLQHFIQAQLNEIMSTAVEANYAVSGLFQDTSGLHKIITETQIISESVSSQNVDYFNPYTAEHMFDFSGSADANGLITLNMKNFGFTASNKADLAKQVALMERVDNAQPLFEKTDQERGFFGINWRGNLLAPLTWIANGGKNILGTVLDLAYIAVKGPVDVVQRMRGITPPPVNFPSGYSWLLKTDLSEEKFAKLPVNTALYQGADQTKIPHRSLLERLYTGAATILSRYLIEPLVSVSNIVADEVVRAKTIRQIIYDSTIGTKPVDETAILLLLTQRISEMRANQTSNEVTQASLIDSYNKTAGKAQVSSYEEIAAAIATRKKNLPGAAVIPYSLTPDNPGDFVTWAANFSRDLAAVFTDEIYRGHPIAGLAFTIAASTAAPMLVPALGNNLILAAINQKFSIPLAKVFVGETSGLMPAISTGILQGKIAYVAVDIFNGRNSLLKAGLKGLIENPVIATVVAVAAVEFGYLLAHDMNVPWLSQKILEETSQASFPYFELGLAGAKIAAILVEGTLNLHKEHNHTGSDHLVDTSIDKLRPEFAEAMKTGYLKEHNLLEKDLTAAQLQEIARRVDEYCDNAKVALKKPTIAAQISQLTYTIGRMVGVPNPPNFGGVPPTVDAARQDELMTFLDRRERRHQIAQLDPNVLSERDKYMITNYLAQVYPDDPDYVASVRNRLGQEKKAGPMGETVKIIFNYPGAIIRSTIAAVRSVGYRVGAVFYESAGNDEAAAAMRATANHALLPVRDLGRKIKNDAGLLVKGVASFLRTTWSLVAGVAMMPVTGILSLPFVAFSNNIPIRIFSAYNKMAFAPARVSQLINAGVGVMRGDVGGRNLGLVTQDMDVRYSLTALNPGEVTGSKSKKSSNLRTVVPGGPVMDLEGEELEKTVIDIMKNAFNKYPTLKTFVTPAPTSFKKLLDNLGTELAKGEQLEKLYTMVNSKPAFNRDLKAALLEVSNKVKVLPGAKIAARQDYQDRLVDMLNINRREPVVEFKNAYAKFINFTLPKDTPKQAVLADIYAKLTAAQSALKNLSTSYDDTQSRVKVVSDLLDQHNCLSLQSVREIVHLKKVISNYKTVLGDDLKTAQQMLQALELAHKSARTTAYRLAVFQPIITSLARLHPLAPAPVAVINPLPASLPVSPPPIPPRSPHVAASSVVVPPPPPPLSPVNLGVAQVPQPIVILNDHVVQPLPLGQLTPARQQSPFLRQPPSAAPSLLSPEPVRTAIATFVMNAIQQAHCDKSARMILQDLEVCRSERANGDGHDTVKISDKWQTFLGNNIALPELGRSHAIIPVGVSYDSEDPALGRDIFSAVKATALSENHKRLHYVLVNSAGTAVAKETAGQYTQNRNGEQTTVTTSQLPPMDAATQAITLNGKTATIPSNEYLLFADKQIQTFINDNGANTKMDITGTDPNLVAAYIIICEAKGLQYENKTEHAKDLDLVVAVEHVHAQTGQGAGKFIAPLYSVDVSQQYNKLKEELKGHTDPMFNAIEKIHLGMNVDKNDLQLMSNLVTQSRLTLPAVNSHASPSVRRI
jgi:hypothetical protein